MGKHLVSATVFDKKGRVLSKATNNYNRSHPMQARFAREAGMPARIYLHAELAALIKLKETFGLQGKLRGKRDRPETIYIERYLKNGLPALAAPCAVCQAALKHWGIKTVKYTL